MRLSVLLLLFCASSFAETPLYRAHAHNDYAHARPLLDALANGFMSVEADVFLLDGELLVGHEPEHLTVKRNLDALYLQPLWQRYSQHQNIYAGQTSPLFLLIDFKTDGEALLRAVLQAIKPNESMLSFSDKQGFHASAVTIIISGNVPRKGIAALTSRRVFIDGRPKDLADPQSPDLMPLISASWTSTFNWNGQGELPAAQRLQLKQLVQQAHSHGQRIRFWATPDTLAAWQELHEAGVDLINTDDLDGLSLFLRQQQTTH